MIWSIGLMVAFSQGELSAEKVFQACEKATARIESVDITGTTSLGSGFVIKDNYVVTCWHVVWDAERIRVSFPGQEPQEATIVDGSERADYAILFLQKTPTPLKVRSERPRPGERLYAIGSPGGLSGSIVDGLMSQARDIDGTVVYQISNPVTFGNSGGPVVDTSARVVGMVSFGFHESVALNFAVPATLLTRATLTGNGLVPSEFRVQRMPDLFAFQFKPRSGDIRKYVTDIVFRVGNREVDHNVLREMERISNAGEDGATVETVSESYTNISASGVETPGQIKPPIVRRLPLLPGCNVEEASKLPPELDGPTARLARIMVEYRPEGIGGIIKKGQSWSAELKKVVDSRFIPGVRIKFQFEGYEQRMGVRCGKLTYDAVEIEGATPMSMTRTQLFGPGLTTILQLESYKNLPIGTAIGSLTIRRELVSWKFAPPAFSGSRL